MALCHASLRTAEWVAVWGSPEVQRLEESLALFYGAVRTCCERPEGLFVIHRDASGEGVIRARLDRNNRAVVHCRMGVLLHARLAACLALANEESLAHQWNPFLTGAPERLGRQSAFRYVVRSTLASGSRKLDLLAEVRRYVDTEAGLVVERMESLHAEHPNYCAPRGGFVRPRGTIQNVWAACGPCHAVLLQAATLHLPVPATRALLRRLGTIGGSLLSGLRDAAARTAVPDNPWQGAIARDELGLYRCAELCTAAAASRLRSPILSSEGTAVDAAAGAVAAALGGRRRPRPASPPEREGAPR